MKTLKEFVKEACQELDAGWGNPNGITVLDKPLKDFLRTKLTECAELTTEAVKPHEELVRETIAWTNELRDEVKRFCPYCGIKPQKLGTALTEIENKKKAWFDTKI